MPAIRQGLHARALRCAAYCPFLSAGSAPLSAPGSRSFLPRALRASPRPLLLSRSGHWPALLPAGPRSQLDAVPFSRKILIEKFSISSDFIFSVGPTEIFFRTGPDRKCIGPGPRPAPDRTAFLYGPVLTANMSCYSVEKPLFSC